jgi:hypothetical protein
MTQEAIDARTTDNGLDIPFHINNISPSQYDPQNFDITWKQSSEPKSSFLREDGTYLPVFTDMETNTREERATRRSQRTNPDKDITFALFVTAPPSGPPSRKFSSPYEIIDPKPRFHNPHLTPVITNIEVSPYTENQFAQALNNNKTNIMYAFISAALPAGSTPKTYKQALSSVDARHWRFALNAEHQQLVDALTWELVPSIEAANIVSGKWVFKIKMNEDGTIDRYKARWVARGFSQRHDIDYTEIFAPVIRYSSIRMLLSLANAQGINIYGLDVSNAFARADVDEEIFVEQPHGYEQYDMDGNPFVCRLKKGLYGTKQDARLWNQKFRKFLFSKGWRQLESDPCIYTRRTSKRGYEIIGLYVDDIIHACNNSQIHKDFLKACNTQFPTTSQGELTWILQMHITRDKSTKTLGLDQTQSILDYIDTLDLPHGYKSYSTPMDDQWNYGDDPVISDKRLHTDYRSQCGSLMYLSMCTRPDITFATHRLCQHLHNPNKQCFKALNRLNCYLASQPHLGLQYIFPSDGTLRLEAYADSSYGNTIEYKARSQSGSVIYFGGGPIDWTSSLQSVVALSTAEAEFIAAFHTSRTIHHFRQFLDELMFRQTDTTVIWEDNQACIAMSKNPVHSKRNKHMLIKYYYIRDLVEQGVVRLEYIETGDQVADILTKATTAKVFTKLVRYIVRPVGSTKTRQ